MFSLLVDCFRRCYCCCCASREIYCSKPRPKSNRENFYRTMTMVTLDIDHMQSEPSLLFNEFNSVFYSVYSHKTRTHGPCWLVASACYYYVISVPSVWYHCLDFTTYSLNSLRAPQPLSFFIPLFPCRRHHCCYHRHLQKFQEQLQNYRIDYQWEWRTGQYQPRRERDRPNDLTT